MDARTFGFDRPDGGDNEHRRQERLSIAMTARLRDRHSNKYDVRLLDLSVTGFADVPAAAQVGLTTVRQPIAEKGRLLGRMLLDPDFTERRLVLDTELVVRSSTGPATP